MKHYDEITIELLALRSDKVEPVRQEFEKHINECYSCRELYEEIVEFYSILENNGNSHYDILYHDNKIYTIGTETDEGIFRSTEYFDKIFEYDISKKTFTKIFSFPVPLWQASVVSYNDRFYILGGKNLKVGLNAQEKVYCFTIKDNWSVFNHLKIGRNCPRVWISNNKLYVSGGYDKNDNFVSELESFTLPKIEN
jgi:N-acetylneuraminic acid mutarotase